MNFKALCSLIPLPVPPTDIGRKRTANISCARRFPERAPKTASRRYGLTLPVIIVFHSTHHSRHPARRTCLTHRVSDLASRKQSEGFGPSFLVSWTISRLSLQHAQMQARVVCEAWEHCFEVAVAEMLGDVFAQHAAVIGGDSKVTALIELSVGKPRPARVDLPTFDIAAHHEHAIRVAVIGPAVTVLVRCAAKFRHADEHHVAHAVTHVLMERRDSLRQIAEQIGKLSLHAAFVDVMIPAAAIEERDFQADVGLEKLRNFLQALAKAAFRILRAMFRLVYVGID